jgi:hypothetical protein
MYCDTSEKYFASCRWGRQKEDIWMFLTVKERISEIVKNVILLYKLNKPTSIQTTEIM